MFRLTRAKYLESLESVEAMQTAMETEMENLGISCGILSNNWFGQQSENSLSMINASLIEGNHAKAYAYTKGMAQVMGEYLPEIEKMMAKREQIGKQLHQDEFYKPDLSTFSEEQLIINYEYIDDIKADAEGAVLYAEKAAEILEEMIETVEETASDYVDLSKVKELLEEGRNEIKRIENYRDEFVDFGKKMSDLEYNMSYDLSGIMRELGDTAVIDNPVVMSELDLKERALQMEGEENTISGVGDAATMKSSIESQPQKKGESWQEWLDRGVDNLMDSTLGDILTGMEKFAYMHSPISSQICHLYIMLSGKDRKEAENDIREFSRGSAGGILKVAGELFFGTLTIGESIESLGEMLQEYGLKESIKILGAGVIEGIEKTWEEEIVNGDARSRGEILSRLEAEILLAVAGAKAAKKLKALQPAKGVTKAVKETGEAATDVSKTVKETVESVVKETDNLPQNKAEKEIKKGIGKGGSVPVVKTQKNVEMPLLPEGSQWERNVLNSFAGGKSTPVTYGGGTTLYRVGGKNGGFWSLDPPSVTEYQWRVDFAIKQEFCNDASTLYKMTIPEGSSLSGLEGTVGTQGMGLYGGAHQVYIDYRAVPSDWIEISPTNWK